MVGSKPKRVLFTVPNIRKFINSRHGFHLLRLFFELQGEADILGGQGWGLQWAPCCCSPCHHPACSQWWGHLPDVGSRVQGRRLASAARDSLSAAAAACFTPGKCRIEFYRAPVRSGDSWMPAHTLLVEFRVLHALVLSQVGLS